MSLSLSFMRAFQRPGPSFNYLATLRLLAPRAQVKLGNFGTESGHQWLCKRTSTPGKEPAPQRTGRMFHYRAWLGQRSQSFPQCTLPTFRNPWTPAKLCPQERSPSGLPGPEQKQKSKQLGFVLCLSPVPRSLSCFDSPSFLTGDRKHSFG